MPKRPEIDDIVDDFLGDEEPIAEVEIFEADDEMTEEIDAALEEEKKEAINSLVSALKSEEPDVSEILEIFENLIGMLI